MMRLLFYVHCKIERRRKSKKKKKGGREEIRKFCEKYLRGSSKLLIMST